MTVGKRDAQVLLSIQKYCDEIRETMRFFGDNEEAFMNSYCLSECMRYAYADDRRVGQELL